MKKPPVFDFSIWNPLKKGIYISLVFSILEIKGQNMDGVMEIAKGSTSCKNYGKISPILTKKVNIQKPLNYELR